MMIIGCGFSLPAATLFEALSSMIEMQLNPARAVLFANPNAICILADHVSDYAGPTIELADSMPALEELGTQARAAHLAVAWKSCRIFTTHFQHFSSPYSVLQLRWRRSW
jgi:hypothetical protein